MGRRASGGQWGSVSGVGLGRGGLEKGAPRRAELGSHGNGGWGALGARRGPAWAFIGAWVSLGAGFLRLGGNAELGECGTGAAGRRRRWRMAGSRGGSLSWRGRVASSDGARGKRPGGARAGGGAELAGRGAWPARWHRRRTAPSWVGSREAGEGDEGRGNLINNPKFKTQFCNFNFSPSSLPQMKKC